MRTATAENIFENAKEYKPEPPRPLMRPMPPATSFPVDALGKVLADAARAINDKIQAPLATCGQSVLAVANLATQGMANVKLPTGQEKPISCYFQSVQETGGRKSACDSEALRPIRAYEAELRVKYEAELPDYINTKMAFEKAQEKALKDGKGDIEATKDALDALGEAPTPPLHYMLTSPDSTIEGLFHHFSIGHASLGTFTTEGGQFIGGHSMSDDAKMRTATALSTLWDGETMRRVRRGDGVQELHGKRLTMHLMVQPEIASVMLTDSLLLNQGLLSRFLITAPDSIAGTRMWKEPLPGSDVALEAYNRHIKGIMQKSLPDVPRVIPLSPDARALWISFADSVEKDLRPGGKMETIAGLANKLPEHAARLAAILALVENPDAGEVSGNHLAAGIELVKHYAAEALRLFGAAKIGANLLLAQRLSNWLRTVWREREPSGCVSLPDIYQKAPISAIRDMASARRIIGILEEHGHVVSAGAMVIAGENRRETWRVIPEGGI